jgi:hypothetical protein
MATTIEKVQSEQTKASTGFRPMPLEPHRRSVSDGVVIVSRHGETATTPGSTGSDPGTPGSRQRAIRKRLASMTGLHHVFSKPKAFPSPGVQCLWPVPSRRPAVRFCAVPMIANAPASNGGDKSSINPPILVAAAAPAVTSQILSHEPATTTILVPPPTSRSAR